MERQKGGVVPETKDRGRTKSSTVTIDRRNDPGNMMRGLQ